MSDSNDKYGNKQESIAPRFPDKPLVWINSDVGEANIIGFSGPIDYMDLIIDLVSEQDELIGQHELGILVIEVTVPRLSMATGALDEDGWEFKVINHSEHDS